MTVIVCIDNARGMLFNKRRQSKDEYLIDDIRRLANGKMVYISPFSEKLLNRYSLPFKALDNPLDGRERDDIVFIENIPLKEYIEDIDRLIVYKWNRDYPADLYLDIDTKNDGFKIKSRREFAGKSHEKITREDYER